MSDCWICGKHRGEVALRGGPIVDDALLHASHARETRDGVPDDVYPGWVFVETKRHAPSLEKARRGPGRRRSRT